jgi:hypothetical protein
LGTRVKGKSSLLETGASVEIYHLPGAHRDLINLSPGRDVHAGTSQTCQRFLTVFFKMQSSQGTGQALSLPQHQFITKKGRSSPANTRPYGFLIEVFLKIK